MTSTIHNDDRSQSSHGFGAQRRVDSLVVRLHRDERSCIAHFSGALTYNTRGTIDGIADLVLGEELVTFDFSRVDVVDRAGADAVEVLIRSVRAHGARLEMAQ
jgi:MFS superfamily sulfate permease-like transporter